MFLFESLSALCRSDDVKRMQVIQAVAYKLLTLQSQLKVNQNVAEITLLGIFHMLNVFVEIGPLPELIVKKLISIVQPFYFWPLPYGSVAKSLLCKLQMEQVRVGGGGGLSGGVVRTDPFPFFFFIFFFSRVPY